MFKWFRSSYNLNALDAVKSLFYPTLLLLCTAAAVDLRAADRASLEFFEKEVRPVLARHCYQCHSSRAAQVFGDLRLDSEAAMLQGGRSGPAVVPGDPSGSRLVQAIGYESPQLKMPPAGKLRASEIEALAEWVRLGAPWPQGELSSTAPGTSSDTPSDSKHWAWQPLVEPDVPSVADADGPLGDIDRFVLAKLEAAGIQPVRAADKYVLLRRLSLDLTGLPPTSDQIRRFVEDESPLALESAVDRLLASSAFGELWGRHWLDLAGYADTLGLGRRIPAAHAWRYRDYVIGAFNRDKPYDEFMREQVAGDVLEFDSDLQRREQLTATGFLAIGPWALVDADKAQLDMDVIDNQLDTLGRALLGLTIGCARCHDHKFDPIPQREYYALAGIFKSTKTLDARMSGVFSGVHRTVLPETPDELMARAEALQRWAADSAHLAKERRIAEESRDQLAAELKAAREDDPDGNAPEELQKKHAAAVKNAADLQNNALQLRYFAKPEPPTVLAMADRPVPTDAALRLGGDPHNPGERVPRGFLSLLPLPADPKIANRRLIGFGFQKSSGRLELAEWLTDPANPLPARVMANRIWHHLFGAGLVRTVDNFGLLGERPSHPELLDFLAVRFREEDWSIKALIREIVLSRTYRLAATNDERAAAADPENRLLWRSNRRRLQAETIRDSILLVSGSLDFQAGGPSLPLQTLGTLRMGQPPSLANGLQLEDHVRNRRTVYLPTLRKSQLPALDVMNLFDFPDPNAAKGRRDVTTVPTQALFLMNSQFLIEHSKRAAKALLSDGQASDADRVRKFLMRALGRPALADDLERATAFLRDTDGVLDSEAAWARYCHAVFASNEFLFRS